ncbi:hypothetical protein HG536_0E05790 [Torulaspora globosa]|uniref:Methyltransferase type 11 domain-containing protein n=1 Tax=Torulaspora globosa TaxID=48254 RepID=A0A7G3ZJI2_9SACH|nr:uncharacterized protein HG536_0E05790 [Torulaspora globosa]QLL33668.1 hypothetical protein HG536_0E05790 [Torulaspora globosa]
MSLYLNKSFNANNYQSFRPTYPPSLYECIMQYHRLTRGTVVDIGCGTGIATFPLLKYFEKVIGCDPSAKMIQNAEEQRQVLEDVQKHRIEFKIIPAEKISSVIPDKSADMIVCAEAIQWVDHTIFFETVSKILKPGGTLAYWMYADPIFLDYPEANKLFRTFVYEDPKYYASYWPPEMQYVRNLGKTIVIPKDKFQDITGEVYNPLDCDKKTAFSIAQNDFTIQKLKNWLRTWSIYLKWQEANRDANVDITDLLVGKLQEKCGWDDNTKIRIEWQTCYYLARNRTT